MASSRVLGRDIAPANLPRKTFDEPISLTSSREQMERLGQLCAGICCRSGRLTRASAVGRVQIRDGASTSRARRLVGALTRARYRSSGRGDRDSCLIQRDQGQRMPPAEPDDPGNAASLDAAVHARPSGSTWDLFLRCRGRAPRRQRARCGYSERHTTRRRAGHVARCASRQHDLPAHHHPRVPWRLAQPRGRW